MIAKNQEKGYIGGLCGTVIKSMEKCHIFIKRIGAEAPIYYFLLLGIIAPTVLTQPSRITHRLQL